MFSDMEKYEYSQNLFNTLYIEINTNVKIISLGQSKR